MSRKSYPTDLTDGQWAEVGPLLPAAKPGGRPRTVDLREVLNATLYVSRTGCAWRHLPHEFPPWGTVHYYYRRFRLDGTWAAVNDRLRERVRVAAGRDPTPSAACVDTQSVRTTRRGGPPGSVGHDANKKVRGRKRHVVVDTLGLVLAVVVHSAGLQDNTAGAVGAVILRLAAMLRAGRLPRLRVIWADGMYRGWPNVWASALGWTVDLVKRAAGAKGFAVVPKRWVVERTFAWLGRYRRLARDYEFDTASSEAMIHIAMINLMLHRLSPG